ncbi:MAG: membrane associated rhomboid family serine protease [Crocinitomix sp.]|jgi:membrane associated rhomboid family serine protease
MFGNKITRISFGIAFTILLMMWVVFGFDYFLELDLYRYGVRPGEFSGLIGVIASPFLHSTTDVGHILNNSLPAFLLTWLLFYHYRTIATKAYLMIFILSGLGTWYLGKESFHIGMSGVIYGLTSFLVLSGFFRKNMKVAGISLFVIFVYGSMIWGIFPIKEGVSWEGHLSGLFAGFMAAVLFKQVGPQPKKLRYEIEEELGIESEEEYWKEGYFARKQAEKEQRQAQQQQQAALQENQPRIIIKYNYVPKGGILPLEPQVTGEEE